MSYNDAEKKLCIDLHNRGVRPEIREGDWVLWTDKTITLIKSKATLAYAIEHRQDCILLWPWSRCRELLKEKGWRLSGHHDGANTTRPTSCSFYNYLTLKDEYAEGQTDLEAILAVIVQVAEEEKA